LRKPNGTEPKKTHRATMFQSTIYARHERRLLDREAAQWQRRQEEQDGSSSHDSQAPDMVSSSADGEVSLARLARTATRETTDATSSSSMSSFTDVPFSMDISSATSVSYSDEPLVAAAAADQHLQAYHLSASADPSYHHHQPQSYTKGSTLLLAASAAATSVWTLSRTAQGPRPFHTPFLSASGKTTAATAAASGGTRQVALLAGACMAAGGHCCPISSPFRMGAGLPVAVKMSALGAMSFFVGGRTASRVYRHQHH